MPRGPAIPALTAEVAALRQAICELREQVQARPGPVVSAEEPDHHTMKGSHEQGRKVTGPAPTCQRYSESSVPTTHPATDHAQRPRGSLRSPLLLSTRSARAMTDYGIL